MQLIFPTSGRAEILGQPVGHVATRQRIGYLPENPYFYDYLTAEELLDYFAQLFGYSAADRAKRVSALARSRRHRRRAPAAAAEVLEGDGAARRHCAGAHQRSRGGLSRRADVGSRPARAPRRPGAHPGPARSGADGLLQLPHPGGCRSALQPCRRRRRGPPRRDGPHRRHPGVRGARVGTGDDRREA